VVVSKSKRTLIAYGAGGKLLAQYPATIATATIHCRSVIGRHEGGALSVVSNYDPNLFWKPRTRKKSASGARAGAPRGPVGTTWIGLTKEHYGIHGTPDPGHIRHDESAAASV